MMNIYNEFIEIKKNEILNPIEKNNLKGLMDELNNFRIPNFLILLLL